jgi:four helix bundle protein
MNGNHASMNARTRSFQDLTLWKRSMELTLAVYRLSSKFPREELFGLTGQLRRAAVSIPSNIAEGYGRLNRREFRRFLLIARGSQCELQTQLKIAIALEYGDRESLVQALDLSNEVGKMLFSMLGKLKEKLD